jgi:hypothetical protein
VVRSIEPPVAPVGIATVTATVWEALTARVKAEGSRETAQPLSDSTVVETFRFILPVLVILMG